MEGTSFANTLLANIVNEKNGRHCRLCLKEIVDQTSLSFNDLVGDDPTAQEFTEVKTIMFQVLGVQALDEIPSLNQICMDCVQSLMECYTFINNYKTANQFLHNVLDNVCDTLSNIDSHSLDQHRTMFLIADECETKAILTARPDTTCSNCLKKFDSPDALKDHECSALRLFICFKCNKSLFDKKLLEAHMRDEHFYCTECHHSLGTQRELTQHIDTFHKDKFICKKCGHICETVVELKQHENSHRKMKCPNCSKCYQTSQSFFKHKELCLSGQYDPQPYRSSVKQSYMCDMCGKSYGTPGGLRVHQRFVHGDAVPHKCAYCDKCFTAPSYLKAHLIKHTGEKNFKCSICNRNFVTKEALLYHTRRHNGEKPYSCKFCDDKFVNSSARAEHIKFKHSAPEYQCDLCSKNFRTQFFLKTHLAKHYDPASKCYARTSRPDIPSKENLRVKIEY